MSSYYRRRRSSRSKQRFEHHSRPSPTYKHRQQEDLRVENHYTPEPTLITYPPSCSLDDLITNADHYSPTIQTLVRELLLEREKRHLIEMKFDDSERAYALLHAQYERIFNEITLLKRDYDQCRSDLKTYAIERNELHENNNQLSVRIDQLLHERQQIHTSEELFYSKRQRRY